MALGHASVSGSFCMSSMAGDFQVEHLGRKERHHGLSKSSWSLRTLICSSQALIPLCETVTPKSIVGNVVVCGCLVLAELTVIMTLLVLKFLVQ